jgi:glycosyltransferase involved in cell wall biosynthesis
VNTIILNLSADLKVAGIAARLAGVQHIIYRRGSAIPIRNTILNRYLFCSIVDEVIANSEETRRTILSKNPKLINSNKIRIIYNGINLEKFDSTPVKYHYQREGDEWIIGNAGRLVKQKGQKYLLDIAEELKNRGYNFKIIIAGEGKMENELKNFVKKRKMENYIKFVGFVDDMKGFMESVDIFILTSIWEGFGYVIVEAMAARTPVVAFDISSNPEIIEDGVTGYLIDPFDTNEMTSKISLLIDNHDLFRLMAKAGRMRVEELFSIDKTQERLESILI